MTSWDPHTQHPVFWEPPPGGGERTFCLLQAGREEGLGAAAPVHAPPTLRPAARPAAPVEGLTLSRGPGGDDAAL